jgi:two-component system sensor histidine kinase KdpD
VLRSRLGPEVPAASIRPLVILLAVTAGLALLTAALWFVRQLFEPVNIALLYLLIVLATAIRWGLPYAVYAAGLSILTFDYFFIPPLLSFAVSDVRYVISFGVYLVVAIVSARLTTSLKRRTQEAQERERVADSLYSLSRRIAAAETLEAVAQAVTQHLAESFHVPALVAAANDSGQLQVVAQSAQPRFSAPINRHVLDWVFRHQATAGFGPKERPQAVCLPLKTEDVCHGVLYLGDYGQGHHFDAQARQTLEALAGLTAVSMARITYASKAQVAQLTAQSERLRTALLDSLSHELRTPVTAILGAAQSLMDDQAPVAGPDRQALMTTIYDSALRMDRLITNLLGIVRLESGLVQLNRRSCDIADLVGVALRQVHDSLKQRAVSVQLPDDTPSVWVDEVLIEQALVNVLSNAVKYSPPHAPIRIAVTVGSDTVRIAVQDYGIGINPEESEKIFEKFFRSPKTQSIPGTGLGLAICQGIMQAHQGRVYARPGSPHGTVIVLELPREVSSPHGLAKQEGQP